MVNYHVWSSILQGVQNACFLLYSSWCCCFTSTSFEFSQSGQTWWYNGILVWSELYRITHSVLNRIPETGLDLTDQWRSDLIAPSPDLQAEWVHLSNISSHTQKHRWLWWRQQWICNTVLTALCICELCVKSVCAVGEGFRGLKGWGSGNGRLLAVKRCKPDTVQNLL